MSKYSLLSTYQMLTHPVTPTGNTSLSDEVEKRDLYLPYDLHYKIFACLWAIATLFHMAHSGIYVLHFHYVLLTLAALNVLYRPASKPSFLFLLSLQLYDTYFKLPYASNHWVFTAFVNLTIIFSLVYLMLKRQTFRVDLGEWLKTFAPIVRIEVFVLYFFAVFHKLNADFFNPEVSCATDLLHAQNLPAFIPLTPAVLALNAYFTIFIEALIPLLLCFRKTRNLGILIGLVFHCILAFSSYNAYYDFTSMVFALYFLFASPQFSVKLWQQWRRVRNKNSFLGIRTDSFSLVKLLLISACFVIGLGIVHVLTKKLPDFHSFHLYFFWTGFSFIFIYLFLRYMLTKDSQPVQINSFFTLPHWAFWILPIVVFLNSFSPYLGLKTEYSLSMFSNLQTENGTSNHYILPASMQVFDYQRDMVEVVSSSDEGLQKLATANQLMVYNKFKNYVAKVRPQQIEYIRNGQHHTFVLAEAKPDHPLFQQNFFLFQKIMGFRDINKSGPQPCSH